MSSIDWELAFYLIFLCSGGIGMLCQIILRITLDRRVRRELPGDKVYDGFYDTYFGIWRACLFANASILPGKRFQKTMDIFYDGFQIKDFANAFEKTVATIYLISGSLMILVCLAMFITDFLGLVDWSSEQT